MKEGWTVVTFFAEHWEALFSLLLSVVAIGIAIYSSRKTSKEATRQIESIKELSRQTIENTTKEIESVKELAKLQIEAQSIELDMEMKRYQVLGQKANEEREIMADIKQNSYSTQRMELMMQDFEMERPKRELQYLSSYIQELERISKRLEQLKKNLK